MTYQTLRREKKDHVAIVAISGLMYDKEKGGRLYDELTEFCAEITWNEEVRVVILTGAEEKSFSGQIDSIGPISELSVELQRKLWILAEPIAKLYQPVIAAINGDAIGQGLELALACDMRIAATTSHFGFPHIKAGLFPWDGGTQRLPRIVGRSKALELILTGETIDAQEAFRIGLVSKVVPSDELMVAAMDMAREMASKGPIALRYAKEAIHKGMDLTLEQGLHLEADLYLLIHTTKDRAEGIQAFREKRTPKFEGR